MGNSFLTHGKRRGVTSCGGSIVLDVTTATKVYAPSFSMDTTGINNLLLDVDIIKSGSLTPQFFCKKCGDQFSVNDIGDSVTATCQICGKDSIVSEMQMHPSITCICNKCIDEIKTYNTSGKGSNRIAEYVNSFGLSRKFNVVPLMRVISSPITI